MHLSLFASTENNKKYSCKLNIFKAYYVLCSTFILKVTDALQTFIGDDD